MERFAGTRAEREWLAALRRIATALERLADTFEKRSGDAKEGGL